MMRRICHIGTTLGTWIPQNGIGRFVRVACIPLLVLVWLTSLMGCIREPELHLFDYIEVEPEIPMVDLDLEAYWDYELRYGVTYDWKAEWFYGWDEIDSMMFGGKIGYTEPTSFNLRRYYTGSTPYVPHTSVLAALVDTTSFRGNFNWGYWDILVWNDIQTIDGVQSLNFDETTSLDYVTAYTNPSMHTVRYNAPRFTRAFYEPEALFAAYDQAIEINKNLEGFEYDAERNVYVKRMNMILRPITYIYLTQVILHNNRNRIIGAEGTSDLSGVARTVEVNSGVSGSDAVTVYYNVRFKRNCDMKGEPVDIIGGRLLTFGICNENGNLIKNYSEVQDKEIHYMDVNMQFNNGMDSTFVFDVTDQVRQRWKGGVITVELDVDTIRIPSRSGGSAFDAVVQDWEDGGTHEFEM